MVDRFNTYFGELRSTLTSLKEAYQGRSYNIVGVRPFDHFDGMDIFTGTPLYDICDLLYRLDEERYESIIVPYIHSFFPELVNLFYITLDSLNGYFGDLNPTIALLGFGNDYWMNEDSLDYDNLDDNQLAIASTVKRLGVGSNRVYFDKIPEIFNNCKSLEIFGRLNAIRDSGVSAENVHNTIVREIAAINSMSRLESLDCGYESNYIELINNSSIRRFRFERERPFNLKNLKIGHQLTHLSVVNSINLSGAEALLDFNNLKWARFLYLESEERSAFNFEEGSGWFHLFNTVDQVVFDFNLAQKFMASSGVSCFDLLPKIPDSKYRLLLPNELRTYCTPQIENYLIENDIDPDGIEEAVVSLIDKIEGGSTFYLNSLSAKYHDAYVYASSFGFLTVMYTENNARLAHLDMKITIGPQHPWIRSRFEVPYADGDFVNDGVYVPSLSLRSSRLGSPIRYRGSSCLVFNKVYGG